MRRGEVWTLRDDRYASKARPVVVVQADRFDESDSVVLALLTTFDNEASPTRVLVEPSSGNGLRRTSFVMAEKLVTVRRSELGTRVGNLVDEQMHAVARKLVDLLGITAEDLGPR